MIKGKFNVIRKIRLFSLLFFLQIILFGCSICHKKWQRRIVYNKEIVSLLQQKQIRRIDRGTKIFYEIYSCEQGDKNSAAIYEYKDSLFVDFYGRINLNNLDGDEWDKLPELTHTAYRVVSFLKFYGLHSAAYRKIGNIGFVVFMTDRNSRFKKYTFISQEIAQSQSQETVMSSCNGSNTILNTKKEKYNIKDLLESNNIMVIIIN